jgi:hypothetical protein
MQQQYCFSCRKGTVRWEGIVGASLHNLHRTLRNPSPFYNRTCPFHQSIDKSKIMYILKFDHSIKLDYSALTRMKQNGLIFLLGSGVVISG